MEKLSEKLRGELDQIPEGDLIETLMNVVYYEGKYEFTDTVCHYLKITYDGMTYPRQKGKSYKRPRLKVLENKDHNK